MGLPAMRSGDVDQYMALHRPTGMKWRKIITPMPEADLLKHVNRWNSGGGDWVYWVPLSLIRTPETNPDLFDEVREPD